MKIRLRSARPDDFILARRIYYETMRWMTERLFGWDETREDEKFAAQFKLDEVRIITVDGYDAGWLQTQCDDRTITLGQFYVSPNLQRRGIGTTVLKRLIVRAKREKKTIALAVVKINPVLNLYEKHGFRITHEDKYKFYMRLDWTTPQSRRRAPRKP